METEHVHTANRSLAKISISVLVGLCLLLLYFGFIAFLGGPILSFPMTEVESLIFYTLLLRVLAVWFVPRLRRTHAQFKIALFSIETFALVILIFGFVLTQQPAYDVLIGQVLTSWIGASSIVLTPYLVYQIIVSMYKGLSSSALVLAVTPEFIVGVYLLGFSIADSSTPPAGIAAFGQLLISSVRAQTAIANAQLAGSNPFIIAISLIVFLCLLFYIGIVQTYQPQNIFVVRSEPLGRASPRFHYQLTIIFGAVLITIVWMLLTPGVLGGDSLFILSLPAIIISSVLWGISRKGK